jgi:hypothetical protein
MSRSNRHYMWSFMTGNARIDAPGALHHTIVMCIKRIKIFREGLCMKDCFMKGLCCGWVFLLNQFDTHEIDNPYWY